MDKPKDSRELAARAADAIDEYGWTRVQLQDESGCLCLAGAFGLAYFGDPNMGYGRLLGDEINPRDPEYVTMLGEFINKGFVGLGVYRDKDIIDAVWMWNDRPKNSALSMKPEYRTQQEVVDTLRAYANGELQ